MVGQTRILIDMSRRDCETDRERQRLQEQVNVELDETIFFSKPHPHPQDRSLPPLLPRHTCKLLSYCQASSRKNGILEHNPNDTFIGAMCVDEY